MADLNSVEVGCMQSSISESDKCCSTESAHSSPASSSFLSRNHHDFNKSHEPDSFSSEKTLKSWLSVSNENTRFSESNVKGSSNNLSVEESNYNSIKGKKLPFNITTKRNIEKFDTSDEENMRTSEQEYLSSAESSENEFSEKCPICLLSFRTQEVGMPENCAHKFCVDCIEEWSLSVQTCPIDRKKFHKIKVSSSYENSAIYREISISEKKDDVAIVFEDDIDTNCEICQNSDFEEVMLLCDDCNKGYHIYCLTPPLRDIPEGVWYCPVCYIEHENQIELDFNAIYEEMPESRLIVTRMQVPRISRTRLHEKILSKVQNRSRKKRSSKKRLRIKETIGNSGKKIGRRNNPPRTYKTINELYFPQKKGKNQSKKHIHNKKNRKLKKDTSIRKNLKKKLCTRNFVPFQPFFAPSNLSLFNNANELEYFSDENVQNEYQMETEYGTILRAAHPFINLRNGHRNRKDLIFPRVDGRCSFASTPNVLSDILSLQERWHNVSKNFDSVHFEQNGQLRFENDQISNLRHFHSVSSRYNHLNSILQAPMHSRGNSKNTSSGYNRCGSQSNTRVASDNTYSTGSGNTNERTKVTTESNYRNNCDGFEAIGFANPQSSNIDLSTQLQSFTNNSFERNRANNRKKESENRGNQRNMSTKEVRKDNISNYNQKNRNINLHEHLMLSKNVGLDNNVNDNTTDCKETMSEASNSTKTAVSSSDLPINSIPPLLPPPWNNTLFQLTTDYELEDDDDSNCPNFCVYSAQSQQVAKSTESNMNFEAEKNQKEDDENEDLVQLDDDDEMSLQTESSIDNTLSRNFERCGANIRITEKSDDIIDDASHKINYVNSRKSSTKITTESEQKDSDGIQEKKIIISIETKENPKIVSELRPENSDNELIKLNQKFYGSQQIISKDIGKSHELGLLSLEKAFPENRLKAEKDIFELYDDTDWVENVDDMKRRRFSQAKNNVDRFSNEKEDFQSIGSEKVASKEEEILECEKEIDRSYTPLLDEKHDIEIQDEGISAMSVTKSLSRIGSNFEALKSSPQIDCSDDTATSTAIATELISEDDINNSDNDRIEIGSQNSRNKNIRRDNIINDRKFKKVSKNQKERNYRTDKQSKTEHEAGFSKTIPRSKSKSKEKYKGNSDTHSSMRSKPSKANRLRRQELPRYDVRYVINQQRNYRDPYGRNAFRRQQSRSVSGTRRRRSFSRSTTCSRSISPKRHGRSFSLSSSPPPTSNIYSPKQRFMSPCHLLMTDPNKSPSRRRSRSIFRSISSQRIIEQVDDKISMSDMRQSSRSSTSSTKYTSRMNRSKIHKSKSKRYKDHKKKKNRKKIMDDSPLPGKKITHQEEMKKSSSNRKRHHLPKNSTSVEHSWSPSPTPQDGDYTVENNISWTPPLTFVQSKEFEDYLPKSKNLKEKKKHEKKKRKPEKNHENIGRKEKRRRYSEIKDVSPAVPSKEVFASGNNILVSVSFNKDNNSTPQTTVVTLPPTREEVVSNNRRSKERQNKKKREKPRRIRKKIDAKPVAIIDLERSPFQVHQEPADIIILTDSEEDIGGPILQDNVESQIGVTECRHQDVCSSYRPKDEQSLQLEKEDTILDTNKDSYEAQQMGPKTPPEPSLIKFSLPCKKQTNVRNPLTDMDKGFVEEEDDDKMCKEVDSIQNIQKIGPNTPPESGPCSPDAYDPFDPTKSPSLSPRSTTSQNIIFKTSSENEVRSHNGDENQNIDQRSERTCTAAVVQEKALNPVELVMALMNAKTNTALEPNSSDLQFAPHMMLPGLSDNAMHNKIEESGSVTVLSNVLISSGKSQHIPIISSPPLSRSSQNIVSKLPIPRNSSACGPADDSAQIDIESPYSPGSADYEDLFEPPPDVQNSKRRSKRTAKIESFDTLFGNTSPVNLPLNTSAEKKQKCNVNRRTKTFVRVGKMTGANNDEQIKVYDDVPNSAVELQVKDKFLRKLNRQERVVEEVKLVLKPKFNKNQISKEDYKEIMRRAVPKICHSKSGEINPKKIKNLIEAYVKKFRAKHKKLNVINTGQVSSAVKCAAYLKKL